MIRVLDSADSTLVEWGRQQQQQHDWCDNNNNNNINKIVKPYILKSYFSIYHSRDRSQQDLSPLTADHMTGALAIAKKIDNDVETPIFICNILIFKSLTPIKSLEHIGRLARMSVLDTEVDGSNPGSSMFFLEQDTLSALLQSTQL